MKPERPFFLSINQPQNRKPEQPRTSASNNNNNRIYNPSGREPQTDKTHIFWGNGFQIVVNHEINSKKIVFNLPAVFNKGSKYMIRAGKTKTKSKCLNSCFPPALKPTHISSAIMQRKIILLKKKRNTFTSINLTSEKVSHSKYSRWI